MLACRVSQEFGSVSPGDIIQVVIVVPRKESGQW